MAVLHVYVAAHQDDWMLFGGEHAARNLSQSAGPVLMIHTTAGDAGSSNGWWEARELATVMAVRRQLGNPPVRIRRPCVRGHSLQRYSCGPAILYFLRCADGGKHGQGFPLHRNRSLSKLRDKGRPLVAVDGSTRYSSWEDFSSTLAKIVVRERRSVQPRQKAEATCIHCGDYATTSNPGDHADHKATADAVRSFAAQAGYARSWYLTYCSRNRPDNLSSEEAAAKFKLFTAYGEALGALQGGGSSAGVSKAIAEEWEWWGSKSYSRWMPPESVDSPNPDACLFQH